MAIKVDGHSNGNQNRCSLHVAIMTRACQIVVSQQRLRVNLSEHPAALLARRPKLYFVVAVCWSEKSTRHRV
jgi:hypothetical protein